MSGLDGKVELMISMNPSVAFPPWYEAEGLPTVGGSKHIPSLGGQIHYLL